MFRFMDEKMGEKLQTLAKILFWTMTGIIILFAFLSSLDSEEKLTIWCTALLNCGLAWIGTMLIYCFGRLIEKVTSVEEKLECIEIEDD